MRHGTGYARLKRLFASLMSGQERLSAARDFLLDPSLGQDFRAHFHNVSDLHILRTATFSEASQQKAATGAVEFHVCAS